MHHLLCLSVDKDYRNENIYFYTVECDENMTKSYYSSFPTFFIILWVISQKLAWFMSLFRVFPDLYNKIYNLP